MVRMEDLTYRIASRGLLETTFVICTTSADNHTHFDLTLRSLASHELHRQWCLSQRQLCPNLFLVSRGRRFNLFLFDLLKEPTGHTFRLLAISSNLRLKLEHGVTTSYPHVVNDLFILLVLVERLESLLRVSLAILRADALALHFVFERQPAGAMWSFPGFGEARFALDDIGCHRKGA